ncbi:LysR family transcriptional regulator [Levilactobacillus brevis]|uniref:LysR family transcriptional regulator n=1 Tax=Levilactobacillus brevis TaxID=1580 RepID=UPI001C1F0139|nr:LysR family transcriptional regulator [Levilactobacillus brevis]MBU7559458.1 LysR family transcriptional regulator [Levilactobacillus brevis]MBU7566542.1 LysR family transcriptional regulator [Levilactobacillus brevis]MCE6011039.1 LysR family transcriptional regulator [Levilactobacillus brevis]MCE6013299.1 LysR family transcriptional regulator [Levilactobacillus brevis]
MDTRKLAVFVDLAETRNYSWSAERLFLAQSTISKDIMALEKAWQVKLFIRAHRQVRLTRVGELLLPKVKAVLQREAELNQAITDQSWLGERPLVIQGLPSLPQYKAFHIMARFAKRYPNVKLKFSEAGVDKLEHALDQKNVDIVFTRIFTTTFPNYDVLTNEQDQFVVLVPKQNPLAQQPAISLEMLQSQSILLLRDTISKTNPLFKPFQAMKLHPHMTYDGQRVELLLEMLNQGTGVSVVMARSFDLAGFDNIQVVPLVPKVTSQLAFMKRRDNPSALVELFWQFATAETATLMSK